MYRGASWMYRSVASDHRPIHSYVFERAGRRTAVTCQHVLRYRGDSGCSPYAIVAVSKTGFVCRQRSQAVTVPADHVFGADAKFRLEFADRAVPRFMREQCPARTMRFGEGFLTFEAFLRLLDEFIVGNATLVSASTVAEIAVVSWGDGVHPFLQRCFGFVNVAKKPTCDNLQNAFSVGLDTDVPLDQAVAGVIAAIESAIELDASYRGTVALALLWLACAFACKHPDEWTDVRVYRLAETFLTLRDMSQSFEPAFFVPSAGASSAANRFDRLWIAAVKPVVDRQGMTEQSAFAPRALEVPAPAPRTHFQYDLDASDERLANHARLLRRGGYKVVVLWSALTQIDAGVREVDGVTHHNLRSFWSFELQAREEYDGPRALIVQVDTFTGGKTSVRACEFWESFSTLVRKSFAYYDFVCLHVATPTAVLQDHGLEIPLAPVAAPSREIAVRVDEYAAVPMEFCGSRRARFDFLRGDVNFESDQETRQPGERTLAVALAVVDELKASGGTTALLVLRRCRDLENVAESLIASSRGRLRGVSCRVAVFEETRPHGVERRRFADRGAATDCVRLSLVSVDAYPFTCDEPFDIAVNVEGIDRDVFSHVHADGKVARGVAHVEVIAPARGPAAHLERELVELSAQSAGAENWYLEL